MSVFYCCDGLGGLQGVVTPINPVHTKLATSLKSTFGHNSF